MKSSPTKFGSNKTSKSSEYDGNSDGDGALEYHNGHDGATDGQKPTQIGCSIRTLPTRLLDKASKVAIEVNPVNAPVLGPLAEIAIAADAIMDPQFLTVLTSKYWGPTPRKLTVSFMEATPADLRKRIISHMNAWTRTVCISFVETAGTGNVRISRGSGGFWSYLGTDVMLIPTNRQTMNLQGFTMNTPDSEFFRVVRHETGHTLGFPHEHMRKELIARIDPQKAYDYFLRTQGWNKAMVDAQVLTSLDDRTIMGTAADQTSIMCYQLPGSITRDGRPITGGVDINATDYAFAGRIYPKPSHTTDDTESTSHESKETEDWGEDEDVQDDMIEAAIQETLA